MTDIDLLNADFARKHPTKFASILGRGDVNAIVAVLEKLPRPVAASIVSRLPVSRIAALLSSGKQESEQWIADAPINDAVLLLSRIPREQCLTLVNSIKNRERRQRLLRHLRYPAHSVGALVTDVPLRLSSDTPAADVVAELRALDADAPRFLVVVHPDDRYFGMLDLWRLLLAQPAAEPIADYTSPAPALNPETSLATAVQDQGWHTNNWLPVIDHEQRILGGVSRASIFAAASRQLLNGKRPGRDVLTILVNDVVYLMGELLTRMLAKRGVS